MSRAIASNALTIFVILLLAVAGAIAWAKSSWTSEGPLTQAICVEVPPGSSMLRVSNNLAEQGAVASASLFRMGANYTERSGLLKAGSFLIEPGASMEQIAMAVTESGRSTCGTEINFRIGVLEADMIVRELDPETQRYEEVADFIPGAEGVETPAEYTEAANATGTRFRVTVAEGATSWQVIDALKRADFLGGESGDVPPEGSLAPYSYEVQPGTDRGELVASMQARQATILEELWQERVDGLPLETPEEAMILASIIEKETGVPEERRQVASVFVNRLERGMRLQTDPTVIYGITEGEGALGRGLRRSELDRATPYNTYVIEGLPPTPIANPGRESIAAALDPASTDYVFFVADGTGGHAFAETLAEHNENVARWRQVEAERTAN
ncbi:endolytic transglycosylase MltG [Roseicyclus sp. F158]|uniref:Endolytic murein transglycosylase n=1 Tax=Tropicimonas omnivorans TaxID=3075590 RepID=A0ABU3DJ54_9RHOB|nr:endolytic transglycosylase MltG [Roseicyclus sp. F158]MDT0683608.1 endolytic transglycosylase MltG [Roseicyclus sp. F158]